MTQMFTPISLGAIALANRLVMAPMTRSRAGDDGVRSEERRVGKECPV